MGCWVPVTGNDTIVKCLRHGDFPKGGHCPACETDPPTDEEQAILAAPVGAGLPSVVDHEGWYVKISDRFQREAIALLKDVPPKRKTKKRAGEKGRKANPLLAAKLADVAIKARRAAVEVTRWREDWEKVEKLEDELRRMRNAH